MQFASFSHESLDFVLKIAPRRSSYRDYGACALQTQRALFWDQAGYTGEGGERGGAQRWHPLRMPGLVAKAAGKP